MLELTQEVSSFKHLQLSPTVSQLQPLQSSEPGQSPGLHLGQRAVGEAEAGQGGRPAVLLRWVGTPTPLLPGVLPAG